jgi:hypothetical protein
MTLRLSPDSSTEIEYVIEGNNRQYARISCVGQVALEAREGTWLVTHTGHRGWDLAATTRRGDGAAWFERKRLRAGGSLLVPDGSDYQLRRRLIRRSEWALVGEYGSLATLGVRTGKDPWDTTIDLALSAAVSRVEPFPLLVLLSCYVVIVFRATETQVVPIAGAGGPAGA